MFKTGTEMHLRLPSSGGERVLHPAVVEGIDGEEGTTRVSLKEDGLEVAAEMEIIIYYDLRREFVQQPARITEVECEETPNCVTLVTLGDPISAESRQVYRVTAISADADAKLGSAEACPLQDVSATGFAVISSEAYDLGQNLPALLRFEDLTFAGTACVQSIRELGKKRTRYGLRCVDSEEGDLKDELNRISMMVQRSQLARR